MQGLKRILSVSVLIITSLAIISCSKNGEGSRDQSNSVDKAGRCTAAFVESYNAVLNDTTAASSVSYNDSKLRLDQMRMATSTCDRFFREHGGVTCNALMNGRTLREIKTDDLKSTCDSVKPQ